jgi:hypothetical protein
MLTKFLTPMLPSVLAEAGSLRQRLRSQSTITLLHAVPCSIPCSTAVPPAIHSESVDVKNYLSLKKARAVNILCLNVDIYVVTETTLIISKKILLLLVLKQGYPCNRSVAL